MKWDSNDIDIKIWQQERDFWIPRIQVILTSNSLLFLGYVGIADNWLGIFLCILALASNAAMLIYLSSYEKRIDGLEDRISFKLPPEYRKKTASSSPGRVKRFFRIIGYSIKGRSGYRMVIVIFLILWVSAFIFSAWGWISCLILFHPIGEANSINSTNLEKFQNYSENSSENYSDTISVEGDVLRWNPSNGIAVNFFAPNRYNNSAFQFVESRNSTILGAHRYETYILKLNSSANWSESAIIKVEK